MKKLTAVLVFGALLLVTIGTVQGQSFWAKYKNHPVPADVNVPANFINEEDGTLDCTACHNADINHDGPKFR